MQAVRHHPPGGPEKLRIVQEDIPEIDEDEVLVKVHAAGVIWMELYWSIYEKEDGTYKTPIPGEDYSGVVTKVGSNVPRDSGIQLGTEVMVFMSKAFSTQRSIDGGMAGYAKTHFSQMVPKPQNLSLTEAASVPLSALTAWQGLFDHANLNAGQTLLVTGAAGPTAIWAVQMGKMVGARVIGTASSQQSFELLTSFGVDQILNYKETSLDSALKNVDVVFDAVGGDTTEQALKVLSKDGTLVSIVNTAAGDVSKEAVRNRFRQGIVSREADRKVVFFIVDMNVAQLVKISELIDEGKLKAVVDSVFEFEDVVSAFKKGKAGHAHGKIVLKGPNV